MVFLWLQLLIFVVGGQLFAMQERPTVETHKQISDYQILNLLNETDATLLIKKIEHKIRPEGGLEVITEKPEEIDKGANYKLDIDKYAGAKLSFRTQRLKKYKEVEVPVKKIKELLNHNDGTLLVKSAGGAFPEIVIDTNNLSVVSTPSRPEARKVKKLTKLNIRNDAILNNIIVHYANEIEVYPIDVQKQILLPAPPIEKKEQTIIIPQNESHELDVYKETKKPNEIKIERLTKVNVIPGRSTVEKSKQDIKKGFSLTTLPQQSLELPLDQIERSARGHSKALVPITRKSGLFGSNLVLNLNDITYE